MNFALKVAAFLQWILDMGLPSYRAKLWLTLIFLPAVALQFLAEDAFAHRRCAKQLVGVENATITARVRQSAPTNEQVRSSVEPSLLAMVEDLPDGGSLPSSLYRTYSVDQIALAIVQRIRDQELSNPMPVKRTPLDKRFAEKDLFSDSEIIIFFSTKDLTSIKTFGFLNQHQTGTTSPSGALIPEHRVRVEDGYLGLRLGYSDEAKALRPKSAMVSFPGGKISEFPVEKNPIGYGNVGAVLKNSVKNRSIWTAGDSLYIGDHSYYVGNGSEQREYLMARRGTFYRGKVPQAYYEAEILGDLGLDDVDHFLIANESLVSRLKSLQKPVYKIIALRNGGYTKGEALYVPSKDVSARIEY